MFSSDEWCAVEGPDWSACSIRLRETDAPRIPVLLEAAEPDFPRLSAMAKETWEDYFKNNILFHRMIELCLDIKRTRLFPERIARKCVDARLAWLRLRNAKVATLAFLQRQKDRALRQAHLTI